MLDQFLTANSLRYQVSFGKKERQRVFFQKIKVFVALKKAACSIDSTTLFLKLFFLKTIS